MALQLGGSLARIGAKMYPWCAGHGCSAFLLYFGSETRSYSNVQSGNPAEEGERPTHLYEGQLLIMWESTTSPFCIESMNPIGSVDQFRTPVVSSCAFSNEILEYITDE